MTILSILRLLPRQGGVQLGGKVLLDGVGLLQLPEKTMSAQYRGRKIARVSRPASSTDRRCARSW
ncbi:hypothetical protein [Cupriavidus sp. TMH.W2]|uniref:hypothetical protein n=1 Tax=Cupriavidus sp. TMH.W2 TaxID=3434465 RepID=UPI003D774C09